MKKKIKNIRIKELRDLCAKNPLTCINCPLHCLNVCFNFAILTKEQLEKEIDL